MVTAVDADRETVAISSLVAENVSPARVAAEASASSAAATTVAFAAAASPRGTVAFQE